MHFLCTLFLTAHTILCPPEFETQDSCVCTLDETFLIKQVKDPNPDEQFLLVLDAAACAIAASLDLPMNRVVLLPANASFPGKKNSLLPATLHTRVPGLAVAESDDEVRIQQRVRKTNRELQWPLPPEREGLNRSIVAQMAKHRDLPVITAFDTFVGNADRSQPNLFYEAKTDRYFGIDLAASFCSQLAEAACVQVNRFKPEMFSSEELEALTVYAETVERLVTRWPAEAIEKLLLEYTAFAGFIHGSTLWNQDVEERALFHIDVIRNNCLHSAKLVQQLRELLQQRD